MDIEKTVAQFVKEQTGLETYLTVPNNPPNVFLVVDLISTSANNQFMSIYSLDIDVWGADENDRINTHENAMKVVSSIPALESIENIFNPRFLNLYRAVDADTGRVRYVVQLECSVCE